MSDRIETIQTSDGAMEVFIAHPDGPGPFPVLVQLMDGLGMREELHDHARRAASWGYYVLSPDLYYRYGLKGPLDFSDPAGREQIMTAFQSLTADKVAGDVKATLTIADADNTARKGKIGVYGFCMGGKFTLVMAQELGERVAAGASIHPGALVSDGPDSPHRNLGRVAATLYFGIADQDPSASPEQMAELEKALGAAHIRYELEWHPGALHGYMMSSRKELYNEATAEKVWGRMEALFARTMK